MSVSSVQQLNDNSKQASESRESDFRRFTLQLGKLSQFGGHVLQFSSTDIKDQQREGDDSGAITIALRPSLTIACSIIREVRSATLFDIAPSNVLSSAPIDSGAPLQQGASSRTENYLILKVADLAAAAATVGNNAHISTQSDNAATMDYSNLIYSAPSASSSMATNNNNKADAAETHPRCTCGKAATAEQTEQQRQQHGLEIIIDAGSKVNAETWLAELGHAIKLDLSAIAQSTHLLDVWSSRLLLNKKLSEEQQHARRRNTAEMSTTPSIEKLPRRSSESMSVGSDAFRSRSSTAASEANTISKRGKNSPQGISNQFPVSRQQSVLSRQLSGDSSTGEDHQHHSGVGAAVSELVQQQQHHLLNTINDDVEVDVAELPPLPSRTSSATLTTSAAAAAAAAAQQAPQPPQPNNNNLVAAIGTSDSKKIDDGMDIYTQPWYHATMGRHQANALVCAAGLAGHGRFLIRQSESNKGEYVLTFNSEGKAKHLRLTPMVPEAPLDVNGNEIVNTADGPAAAAEGRPDALYAQNVWQNVQNKDNKLGGIIGHNNKGPWCRIQNLTFSSIIDMIEYFKTHAVPLDRIGGAGSGASGAVSGAMMSSGAGCSTAAGAATSFGGAIESGGGGGSTVICTLTQWIPNAIYVNAGMQQQQQQKPPEFHSRTASKPLLVDEVGNNELHLSTLPRSLSTVLVLFSGTTK